MPVCVHKGCEQTYNEEENNDEACLYHPKPPIFHEGLKGWQCCKRRVTTFEEFQNIPGCTRGRHSSEVQKPPETVTNKSTDRDIVAPSNAPKVTSVDENGVEVYGTGAKYTPPTSTSILPPSAAEKPVQPVEDPEDDLSIPVAPGTKCKRKACDESYVDEATNRGEGPKARCIYHPGVPIFHEGSKGWSCCSRKVLEFEEFLKIKGCKSGNHLFVGPSQNQVRSIILQTYKYYRFLEIEEIVTCRHDWYQTPAHVIMSIFLKKTDKQVSTVVFKEKELVVDLKATDGKRFVETFSLYQPIDPENSKYEFLSTKVEIKLKKANGISWPSLRSGENYGSTTTFGVQGGNATVGGKDYTLATDSPLYANKQ
ncbi:17323_t:CDS:2 [Acaulospora morrowiae]|uniref:17323_t:CDS:1 n=1 Tax=Acaulospora morrowiae TaxID=94023 RepID=A0A9N9FAR3_9GLOM|nr:17323_t:CDS:2 [Acaulospora morrowiae]